MELCFATNNSHKLAEIQALLGPEFSLKTLADIGCQEDIPEDRPTIPENSLQKAEYIWNHYSVSNFADDTGLEVYALDGEPGVHSARYAGPQRDADDNMAHLWQRLSERNEPLPARARFVTVITLVLDGNYHQFEGSVEGHVISEKRGTQGFGYDPIFVPEGQEKTFAELSMAEKGQISHRARAFAKLVAFLQKK